MKQKRNKWVVRLNTKQRPSRGGGHTDKKEKNERRCTPLLQEQNLFFFGWKINLSFKTKTILDQAICFFSSLSLPSVLPRATDARAQEATRELSLLTGKGKNRFCSYLGKVLPFIFAVAMIIYIFGRYKCYAVCLCDWEGTREFAERREKRAQSAQIERDGNTLREGNKPPLPPSNSPKTTLLDFCSSRK